MMNQVDEVMRQQKKFACMNRWTERMMARKEWTKPQCEKQLKLLVNLFKEMVCGYVALSYQLKVGSPVLVTATLACYEEWFHKPFAWEDQNGTIPYWDSVAEQWNTFEVENVLDWRIIY